MQLHDLTPAPGSTKNRKRVGRGNSSGHGTTSGRGQKGQGSRSGGTKGAGFEGGQTPLAMRLPKLPGFRNPRRIEYTAVNVERLERKFEDGAVIDGAALKAARITKSEFEPVKVLGNGEQGRQGQRFCAGQDRGRRRKGRAAVLNGLKNAFRIKELREKILFTIAMLVVYRIGAHVPVPGIPFQGMLGLFSTDNNSVAAGAMALLNLFSGGALSYVSVFSLGIMPYITSSIILQMLQAVVPSLHELAREGEVGQTKITQYSRYLTLALAILNSVGYLFLFKSFGISFNGAGAPEIIFDLMIVGTLTAGAMLIMWIGELITQRGIGNGMSLIIFANIMAGLPQAIFSSTEGNAGGIITMVIICAIILLVIPLIVFLERGQRRIPVSYAKRVVGRRMMGGQTTYLPIKVNTAGVVPIIFASALLYFPAQIAVFFPGIGWIQAVASALSTGWLNWVLNVVLIVFFAYFYTSMVFNPDDTADNLKKQGGFIPGVRPGRATAAYIKNALNKITLPSAVFLALIAIVPSIIFSFTGNHLIQAFGGTSILIMVGVVLDTVDKLEGQIKMYDYDGFFK